MESANSSSNQALSILYACWITLSYTTLLIYGAHLDANFRRSQKPLIPMIWQEESDLRFERKIPMQKKPTMQSLRWGWGEPTKGFYLAKRWANRNFTFLWGSPVLWPHLIRFCMPDGVILRMWTRFLSDEAKRCAPITSGIQPMEPN